MSKVDFGDQVRVIKDSCEGTYEDLVGKTVTVVEVDETEEPEIPYTYLVTGTGRPTKSEYLEGDEEVVVCTDVEVVSRQNDELI
ncbi:hypothetical protein [Lentibacillus salicampi]|uniref:Uncharacterized protein n=1 Tax=Lentibacillus salicampi TaxID=175306 RepID=A0A4Y9AFA0_9BACI|nr:hypothetical protein [Lentibacillus salicampi]TFJ93640.1 hypothetical protein E4U82_06700 [Lentibacillus salicampi]